MDDSWGLASAATAAAAAVLGVRRLWRTILMPELRLSVDDVRASGSSLSVSSGPSSCKDGECGASTGAGAGAGLATVALGAK